MELGPEVTPGPFALGPPLFFVTGVSGGRLETRGSSGTPSPRPRLALASPSGTGQISPLGAGRPSNITQPFDLSTPGEAFSHRDGLAFCARLKSRDL